MLFECNASTLLMFLIHCYYLEEPHEYMKYSWHCNHNYHEYLYDNYFVGLYEVLPTEPLHDVKEHICNVFTELPAHLEKEEKEEFQQILECAFAGKEKLRGCDYRLAAVIVAQYLRGTMCKNFYLHCILQIYCHNEINT